MSSDSIVNMNNQPGLKPVFSVWAVFALSIGASIGWGSFVVTCGAYLQKAGFLGTFLGMAAGMMLVLVIAWNLQYMIGKSPGAGGVYTFKKRLSGDDTGFVAFWFVLLVYLAVLWGNITAVPLFARLFVGGLFQFGPHYTVLGYDVWAGEVLLSIGAIGFIGLLCAKSAHGLSREMTAASLTFVIGFALCAAVAVFRHEPAFSYSPLFAGEGSSLGQIVRIAAISPWAFIGFENIAHFSEEYDFPVRKVRGILVCSVVATAALYLLVSVLSIAAYPPEYASWLEYFRDLDNLDGLKALPAFYAAYHYLGGTGVAILLVALFCVILTSLIANLLALSRLLFAAGRARDVPQAMGALNARGVPENAIWAVVALSALIPFLGRTAIGWVLDVTTLGATVVYGLVSHGVYLQARSENRRLEQATGLAGLILMIIVLVLLLVPGLLTFHAMQTESYALFIAWSLLGLLYFSVLRKKKRTARDTPGVVVWIALMLLMMFSALMWASREVEIANRESMEDILQYQSAEAGGVMDEGMAQRTEFLKDHAQEISRTNTQFTLFSLALFLLFSGALLYRNQQRIREIAEQRRRVIAETERDALTGLYSASYFRVYAERLGKSAKVPMDAVSIDIERFHSVNALNGRDFGDRVLKELALELKRFAGEAGGIACRIGSDRFSLYSPHREDWQGPMDRFREQLDGLFPSAHIHLRMGVKPGSRGEDVVTMFECSRMACNRRRGQYQSRAVYFDEQMRQRETHEQRLLNDLNRAIRERELVVYYQPKFDIQADPPRLNSAEALVRWRHPELGMVSPGEFIPLFEKTGRISEVDEYVWHEAARQIAEWRDRLGKTLPVSVNLSRVDLFNPDLTGILNRIRDGSGLKAGELKLEVTESAYTNDPGQLISVVEHLQREGYAIEMDDFGSGYSSLNMLSAMPIDLLKMDIGFIRNIERSDKDRHLVQVVVNIARHMNVPVVAEGVETERQLELLRDAGCNLGQGYLFSRPLPPAEFEEKILRAASL